MRLPICIAALASLVFTGAASAEDKIFRQDLRLHELAEAFEDVAGDLDLSDFLIRKGRCGADVQATCTYTLSGEIALLAAADEPEGPVKSMTLIFGKDSEAFPFLVAIGLMTSVAEPDTTPNGRGRVVKAMMDGIDEDRDVETTTKNVRFKRMKGDFIGIWVIAEPR